jgi:hypothetical protein
MRPTENGARIASSVNHPDDRQFAVGRGVVVRYRHVTITIQLSSAEIIADPGRFADALRAGDVVISDLTYQAIKKLAERHGHGFSRTASDRCR